MNVQTLQGKQIFVTGVLLTSLLFVGTAFAQEETVTEETGGANVSVGEDSTISADRDAVAETRAEIQENRQGARADAAEERALRQEEMRAGLETYRASTSAEREARMEEVQVEREERRAALSNRISERITNLAANISNKMDAAAARIQNIITRLDSRIDKLAEAGLDVSEATAALGSAQISLNAAVNNLATIDVTVQAAISSEDPRSSWTEVRTAYQNIREQLRTSHTEIKASVQALKDAAQNMERERGASSAVRNQRSESSANEAEIISENEAGA